MEEDNDVVVTHKITMAWSEIIVLGMMASLIFYHDATQNAMAFALLVVLLFVKSAISVSSLSKLWVLTDSLSQSAMMGNTQAQGSIDALYPFSWPRLASTLLYGAAGLYLIQHGVAGAYLVAMLAITPTILNYFVYDKIIKFINNPAMQEVADSERKFFEDDDKRTLILQEEINKVMPQAFEKAKARWKEEGIYLEELNEYHEPVESDQSVESETGDDE